MLQINLALLGTTTNIRKHTHNIKIRFKANLNINSSKIMKLGYDLFG